MDERQHMPVPSPAEQEIVKRHMEAFTEYALGHLVPVAISRRPGPDAGRDMRTASGFLLDLGGQTYFGTAYHLWEQFLERHGAGEDVQFQAESLVLDPSRELRADADRDLAFFPLSASERKRFKTTSASAMLGWPPPVPDEHRGMVLLTGCPEYHQHFAAPDAVGLGTLSMVLPVVSSTRRRVVCEYDQNRCVSSRLPLNPQGTNLSGLSGGPAFMLAGELAIALFGVVSGSSTPTSESGDTGSYAGGAELIYVSPFADTDLLS